MAEYRSLYSVIPARVRDDKSLRPNAKLLYGELSTLAYAEGYSKVGMSGLVRQIDNIRRACPQVKVAGCLVTQWRRSDVAEDAVQILKEDSPVPFFRTVIRRTEKVVEANWAGMPVGMWSPFSSAGRDYRTWVAELLAMEGKENG